MNVRLHIERLVIDGVPFERSQGPALQAAVEAELGRLIAEGGLAPGLHLGGALACARGGDIEEVAHGATPADFGQVIGRAVYGGIRP